MTSKSERLSVLSDIEQFALYGLPDFDDGQQLEYLSLSEAELMLDSSLHAFFRFAWDDGCAFVLSRCYIDQIFSPIAITKREHYI